MLDLSSGLGTGIVATSLCAMVGLAVWFIFRRDTHEGQSLFLKMIDPFDDEINECSTISQATPSRMGNFPKGPLSPSHSGIEVLKESMRLTPVSPPHDTLREFDAVSFQESQDGRNSEKTKPFQGATSPLGQ